MTEPIVGATSEEIARWHRTLAPLAFNNAWELLDAKQLSREQEEDMLASALAARQHWYQAGDARNRAISDWQVSRVASVLGYTDLAARFGERSLQVAAENALGPFIIGFAHEAIARAAAEVDDLDTFSEHLGRARALLPEIVDEEERELLAADLAEMSED